MNKLHPFLLRTAREGWRAKAPVVAIMFLMVCSPYPPNYLRTYHSTFNFSFKATKPIHLWSAEEVSRWLEREGGIAAQIAKKFTLKGEHLRNVSTLTESSLLLLQRMGISELNDQLEVINAVQRMLSLTARTGWGFLYASGQLKSFSP